MYTLGACMNALCLLRLERYGNCLQAAVAVSEAGECHGGEWGPPAGDCGDISGEGGLSRVPSSP